MTTRQEATQHALRWAERADLAALDHINAVQIDDHAHIGYFAALGHEARNTADMWTRIAQLLPPVLDDPEPTCTRCHDRGYVADFSNGLDPVYGEPGKKPCPSCQPAPETCRFAFPDLGFADHHPGHCILPAGHQPPHRNETGAKLTLVDPATVRAHLAGQRPTRCTDRFLDSNRLAPRYCERTAGHHGHHAHEDLVWTDQDQANAAASTTSPAQLPGQRPHTEDEEPRCLSRYQAAAGVERCEREAGHTGAHHGVTVGWRTEQAIVGPDYLATAPATSCCLTAVTRAAELLRQHARTAPGLTGAERRALEDAADYVHVHRQQAARPGGAQ